MFYNYLDLKTIRDGNDFVLVVCDIFKITYYVSNYSWVSHKHVFKIYMWNTFETLQQNSHNY